MRARFRPALPALTVLLTFACSGDEHEGSTESTAATTTASTSEATDTTATTSASGTTDASASSTAASTTASTDGTASSTDGSSTTQGGLDDCPRVRVVVEPGQSLNIRPAPSTQGEPVGALPKGAIVDVLAAVKGEAVDGIDTWYQITSSEGDGYVWGGLVECTLDQAPELLPPDAFWLPLQCGTSALVTQGNNGGFSHYGTSAYGFDFGLALGTPLVAIADGVVQTALFQTMPGDPCYNGGGQECGGKENLVTLLHGDGTTSTYVHLSGVSVGVGEFVPRGAEVGLVGSTGWSTGRHAHVQRQENCGWGFCQSIPVAFADVPGDGVPLSGQNVTSMNCP